MSSLTNSCQRTIELNGLRPVASALSPVPFVLSFLPRKLVYSHNYKCCTVMKLIIFYSFKLFTLNVWFSRMPKENLLHTEHWYMIWVFNYLNTEIIHNIEAVMAKINFLLVLVSSEVESKSSPILSLTSRKESTISWRFKFSCVDFESLLHWLDYGLDLPARTTEQLALFFL